MRHAVRGPGPLALLARAFVLAMLIAQAFAIYARRSLGRRIGWPLPDARFAQQLHRLAVRFVRVATRFKGGLIKVGQVASLRLEVLPRSVTDELAKLQDRVEAHPIEEICAQVESEFGQPLEQVFAAFEPQAIAAASLGQVHRARSHDGRELAVKVLYPGIERSVGVDLAMTKLALWGFDFFVMPDLMQVYRELRDSILGEMDYEREGRAAEEMAANLARDIDLAGRIRVPRIHWDLCRRRVLAMEFVPGARINDRARLAEQGHSIEESVRWVSRAFCQMLFRDGFFHCDPHPGNLLVDAEGCVVLLDFGMNQRLAPGLLGALRRNVVASATKNSELYARSLVEAGAIDERDVPIVRELAELSFDPALYNLTPQEVASLDLGAQLERTRDQLKSIRSFRLPEGFLMWSRALSLLYGLMVELAPGIRPLEVFGPYVLEFMSVDVNAGVPGASKSV